MYADGHYVTFFKYGERKAEVVIEIKDGYVSYAHAPEDTHPRDNRFDQDSFFMLNVMVRPHVYKQLPEVCKLSQ